MTESRLKDLLETLADSLEGAADAKSRAQRDPGLRSANEFREAGMRPASVLLLAEIVRTVASSSERPENVLVVSDYQTAWSVVAARHPERYRERRAREPRQDFSPVAAFAELLNKRSDRDEWLPFPAGTWWLHFERPDKNDLFHAWIGLRDAAGNEMLSAGRPSTSVAISMPVIAQKPRENEAEREAVLRQVPEPVADFQPRSEVAHVVASVKNRAAGRIVLLHGLPGAGKRQIARAAARLLRNDFPGGEIHLEFATPRSRDELDSPAERAFVLLLSQLSRDGSAPLLPELFSGTYNQELRRRPVLIVLENLPERFPLHKFVPPVESALIATSYHAFHDGSIEVVPVAVPPNGARWLRSMSATLTEPLQRRHRGAIPENRRRDYAELLSGLVGHLPLALRIVVSLLAEHSDLTAAHLTDRLLDEQRRLGELTLDRDDRVLGRLLGEVYNLLDPDAQAVLRRLAIVEGAFDGQAARKIGGDRTSRTVSSLTRHSLLTFDSQRREYRMHELTRLFARELLDENEANAAARAHATYFLWKVTNDAGAALRHLPDSGRAARFLASAASERQMTAAFAAWLAEACLRVGQAYATVRIDPFAQELLVSAVVFAKDAGAAVTLDKAARMARRIGIRSGDRKTVIQMCELLAGSRQTPQWQIVVSAICAAESHLLGGRFFQAESWARMALQESRSRSLHHLALHARLIQGFVALVRGERSRAAAIFRHSAVSGTWTNVDSVISWRINPPTISGELGGLERNGALDLARVLRDFFAARPGRRREIVRTAARHRSDGNVDVFDLGITHLLRSVGLAREARDEFNDIATRCSDPIVARVCRTYSSHSGGEGAPRRRRPSDAASERPCPGSR